MSDASKMLMQTPQDLFVHELSTMHSAEHILVQMLQEGQGLVQDPALKDALQLHEEQTRQHAERLEQAFQILGAEPHPVTCHTMQGLVQELMEARKANPSPEVLQSLVADGASKSEHFEIAAYTGLITKAEAMGQSEVLELLQQNFKEEQEARLKLQAITEHLARQMAGPRGGMAS